MSKFATSFFQKLQVSETLQSPSSYWNALTRVGKQDCLLRLSNIRYLWTVSGSVQHPCHCVLNPMSDVMLLLGGCVAEQSGGCAQCAVANSESVKWVCLHQVGDCWDENATQPQQGFREEQCNAATNSDVPFQVTSQHYIITWWSFGKKLQHVSC